MRITKIERQKKRSSRVSVFIDGTFAFGVSDDIMLRFALHEGAELDDAAVCMIQGADNEETAKQSALRYLSIRPRSKKEMRDYLLKKEYPADLGERVIARLEALNMLDDASFARMVCRDALAKKPAGGKMLRQMMMRKGVPAPLVESVLAEFSTPDSEFALAVKAAERHSARLSRSSRKLDEDRIKKKILEYLVRRGFAFDTALSATKKFLSK